MVRSPSRWPFQYLFLWSWGVLALRSSPRCASLRTPNPDHKGTNTIGREVREEIGWENGRRMNGNNSWMKGRSWSCSTVHSSVLFHPIGGAVAWAVVGVCGHERLKGKKNCWREGWSRPPLQAFVLFTHAWWLTRTSPRQQIIYFPFNQKKFPGHA